MRIVTLLVSLALVGSSQLGRAAEVLSDKVSQAVRARLPTYDPEVRLKAEQARAAAETAAAEREKSPPAVPVAPMPAAKDSDVVQLEPFVVRQRRVKEPPLRLPRVEVAAPAHPEVDTSDPYLSPEERLRRVRKKWGSPADYFLLNWLFGSGVEKSAEARERYAGQLGGLAKEIELASAAGATPEEIKQLREMYLQLYLARPK